MGEEYILFYAEKMNDINDIVIVVDPVLINNIVELNNVSDIVIAIKIFVDENIVNVMIMFLKLD